jgi:alpha-mannosidase
VFGEGAKLNQKILIFSGMICKKDSIPCKIISEGISIEVIKKAEKSDDLIIRLVEYRGLNSIGKLVFNKYPISISETNLVEWEDNEIIEINNEFEISMKPFEIRTYKIHNL